MGSSESRETYPSARYPVNPPSSRAPPAPYAPAPVTARGLEHNTQWGAQHFHAIADNYQTIEQVQAALRQNGLESSNLIVAVDFTKSNEWTGQHSFGGRSLHHVGAPGETNPYQQAISTIGQTLEAFDDDQLIPCYGFGDVTTKDTKVFSFYSGDQPCQGLQNVLLRYEQLAPHIKLSGPTSFAPAIYQAIKVVEASGGEFHILLLLADGQVTRSVDLPLSELSPQEHSTVEAIVAASNFPLSIIMIGVGDGPWDVMKNFDDQLPSRAFDNFQFVNFTELAQRQYRHPEQKAAAFALRALMEVPEQYKLIAQLGLLRRRSRLSDSQRPPWRDPRLLRPPPIEGAPFQQAPRPSAPPMPSPAAPPQSPPATNAMFVCPITQEVMSDPVIAADGFTYERSGIENWLKLRQTSPMTNAAMPSTALIPNHMLRSAIMEARQQGQLPR